MAFNIGRREALLAAAALGGAAGLAGRPQASVRTRARIVILGAGAAGLAAANRLAGRLEGAEITLVDRRRAHLYQPGFTLVAAGLKPKDYVVSTTREWIGRGITLVEESAAEIDPVGKRVVTDAGRSLPMIS